MNDQLVTFSGDEHDDFEEVRRAVRTDDEPPVRVLAEVIDDDRVFDGMEDVVVSGSVATRGRVDLYTAIL